MKGNVDYEEVTAIRGKRFEERANERGNESAKVMTRRSREIKRNGENGGRTVGKEGERGE